MPLIAPNHSARAMVPPIRTLREFRSAPVGSQMSVGGWVEDVRNLGSIAFVLIRLREATVQVTTKKKTDEALFRRLTELTRERGVRGRGFQPPPRQPHDRPPKAERPVDFPGPPSPAAGAPPRTRPP